MAVTKYKKYKISLNPDTKKIQGLRVGDIVRRQYYDGKNVIYSLMCVLDFGETEIVTEEPVVTEGGKNDNTAPNSTETQQVINKQPWFVGALLEGDAPKPGEILDFVRVTNLFDTDRSGALYLTASDSEAPFMDVIDGIGRNCSLSWPESLSEADPNLVDPKTQYCVVGTANDKKYIQKSGDRKRICYLKKGANKLSISQKFYEYIDNYKTVHQLSHKNQLVISYWVKKNGGTSETTPIDITLGYADGVRTDGILTESASEEWEYKLHLITIENSGRQLRSLTVDFNYLQENEEIYIADFNIILLSSLSNFGDASQIRVGKLSGIVDPVFGKLDGYGGYLQKLFASQSAHISGTLTAGDENGFAATFYAGKIHKNVFLNSLNIPIVDNSENISIVNSGVINPTGVGEIYAFNSKITVRAQSTAWLQGQVDGKSKVGQLYCFSFWIYSSAPCQMYIAQDSTVLGSISIDISDSLQWRRHHIVIQLSEPEHEDLLLSLNPIFEPNFDAAEPAHIFFTAPQLEQGYQVTQYQPTDDTLSYCSDYGAWFNRGGIGGTIQNPLLRLNYDGNGGIATRPNASTGKPSFALNLNGSGHLAHGNISWSENGDVTFGDKVKLKWENLSNDITQQIEAKSLKIIGGNTFNMLITKSSGEVLYSPHTITLEANIMGYNPSLGRFEWMYQTEHGYEIIPNQTGSQYLLDPTDAIWDGNSFITIKCVFLYENNVFEDTITITKQCIQGYSIEITSSKGGVFKNGKCDTVLTAELYYQGFRVDPQYINENFNITWSKFDLDNPTKPIWGWWESQEDQDGNVLTPEIDRFQLSIPINTDIDGSDQYTCTIETKQGFVYDFPALL